MKHSIRNCKKHNETEFVHLKTGSPRCLLCLKEKAKRRRSSSKKKAISYKGGKCFHCSYFACDDAMEFHHTNSKIKDSNVSKLLSRKWEILQEELDKCILLCSNCHRIEHSKNKFLSQRKKTIYTRQWREEKRKQIFEKFENQCSSCGISNNVVFEFHHLESSEKEFGISSYISSMKYDEKLQEELKKCIMLCCNCHRELHSQLNPR